MSRLYVPNFLMIRQVYSKAIARGLNRRSSLLLNDSSNYIKPLNSIRRNVSETKMNSPLVLNTFPSAVSIIATINPKTSASHTFTFPITTTNHDNRHSHSPANRPTQRNSRKPRNDMIPLQTFSAQICSIGCTPVERANVNYRNKNRG